LCGKSIVHSADHFFPPPSHSASAVRPSLPGASAAWVSTSRFFRAGSATSLSRTNTAPSTPTVPSIFIFRLYLPSPQKSQPYALCQSGWCLARLRTSCELWRFVRKSIVEKVWEEDVAPPPYNQVTATPSSGPLAKGINLSTPPVPPRRTASRVGTLWEKGLRVLGVDVANARPTPATPQAPPLLPVRSPSRCLAPTLPKQQDPTPHPTSNSASMSTPKEESKPVVDATPDTPQEKVDIPTEPPKVPEEASVMTESKTQVQDEPGTLDLGDDVKVARPETPVRAPSPTAPRNSDNRSSSPFSAFNSYTTPFSTTRTGDLGYTNCPAINSVESSS
jgi:hypothetical protein